MQRCRVNSPREAAVSHEYTYDGLCAVPVLWRLNLCSNHCLTGFTRHPEQSVEKGHDPCDERL